MLQKASFALKWEKDARKSTFPISKGPPYRIFEQTHMADSMNFDEVYNLTVTVEDEEIKRKQRWKSLRQVYLITRETPPYHTHSLENTLFANSLHTITEEHFVMSIINEYKFPNKMKVDVHLRWLYWSFDKNRQNIVDWREILIAYKILIFYRFVRDRTLDLILLLFDIYAEGVSTAKTDKEKILVTPANHILSTILLTPCITDSEIVNMRLLLEEELLPEIETRFHNKINRKNASQLLTKYPKILTTWSNYCWERLSSEMRLTVLDEATMQHQENADMIIARRQLSLAIGLYTKHIKRRQFIAWKLITIRLSGANAFILKILKRQSMRLFVFWLRFTKQKVMKRRRRILATVIGAYNIKARCFLRIKVFNQTIRKIEQTVGTLAKKRRIYELGGCHIREYYRLSSLRALYHRWWNICVALNHIEVAEEHNRIRIMSMHIKAWYNYAHTKALEERYEYMVRENKLSLERMLAQADEHAAELLQLEAVRKEKQQLREEALVKQQKQQKLEESKARLKAERNADDRVILTIQREQRKERIQEELQAMQRNYLNEFERKSNELILRAKERITIYIENPENKLAIDMKFNQLKREFFANPSPETKERERILTSYKNILFLYIDAKLMQEKLELKELIPQFDIEHKGYLTYKEFAALIRSTGVVLNESQISSVIRGIDADRDGYIAFEEVEHAGKEIQFMGVPGSPWKLYVDPIEDVITYHNFLTNEKIYEYEMQDMILKKIVIANLYGEADYKIKSELREQKKTDWIMTMKHYMAKRIQHMYYRYKGKQYRAKRIYKIQKRLLKQKIAYQRTVLHFLEKSFYGKRSRKIFQKQLSMTIEKLYDSNYELYFYYNHVTHQSTWEIPYLIKRYGDSKITTMPCPWIPLQKINDTDNGVLAITEGTETLTLDNNTNKSKKNSNSNKKKKKLKEAMHQDQQHNGNTAIPAVEYVYTNGNLHYYHLRGKREFPCKPDGYLLCQECSLFLAIRTCIDCNHTHYCFTCHRKTHSHPLGFAQRYKIRKQQLHNKEFMEQLHNFDHQWIETKPLSCQLCKNTKVYAAFSCITCSKRYCRQCYYRYVPLHFLILLLMFHLYLLYCMIGRIQKI